jgi:hypothetical protein
VRLESHFRTLPHAAGVLLAALLCVPPAAFAADAPADPGARRGRDAGAQSPTISFIANPTATCDRPEKLSSTCRIAWEYLYVTADAGQYILDMTVEIDGRFRALMQGFFQTYVYVPAEMLAPGFGVPCGAPGAGGDPNRGAAISYVLRARESSGLSAANYGTVWCPFALLIFEDDFERGNPSAWSSHVP